MSSKAKQVPKQANYYKCIERKSSGNASKGKVPHEISQNTLLFLSDAIKKTIQLIFQEFDLTQKVFIICLVPHDWPFIVREKVVGKIESMDMGHSISQIVYFLS